MKVKVDEMQGESIFSSFYTCFKACKDAFVVYCPFIGLDDCFLKGKYGGELLTAVARDANNQMLPLAYAIVEVKNKETWKWFLEILVDDLGETEVCGGMYIYVRSTKGMHVLFIVLFFFIFNIFEAYVVFIFLHIFAL